jgi:hypothetical protein
VTCACDAPVGGKGLAQRPLVRVVVLALALLAAGCGAARHNSPPSPPGRSALRSAGSVAAATAPAHPCGLLTLEMAQRLYANVKAPASATNPSAASEISECDYYGPNRSFYVNDVSVEAGTLQVAKSLGGSSYLPPRQLAARIVGNPSAADDNRAYAVDLPAPGSQAVFIFEYKTGGGSDQSVTWIHGDLQVSIDAYSQGSTGSTKSLQQTLIAEAITVESQLP